MNRPPCVEILGGKTRVPWAPNGLATFTRGSKLCASLARTVNSVPAKREARPTHHGF